MLSLLNVNYNFFFFFYVNNNTFSEYGIEYTVYIYINIYLIYMEYIFISCACGEKQMTEPIWNIKQY